LSWRHFLILLTLRSPEAKLFNAKSVVTLTLGVRDLCKQITAKIFKRTTIANYQIQTIIRLFTTVSKTFIAYLLDFLGLQNTYWEEAFEKVKGKSL
jgi:predicted nuclease of restriction endonuclease-like (RecB) superfamily